MHTTSTYRNDLSYPSAWDPSEWTETNNTQMMIGGDEDEEMFSSNHQTTTRKVLEQWLSDDGQQVEHSSQQFYRVDQDITVTPCDTSASSAEHDDADLTSLMEVDEQIGENLLGAEVFGGQLHLDCVAAFPIENCLLNSQSIVESMSEDDRQFFAPLLEDTYTTTTMDYDAGFIVTDDDESLPSRSSSRSPNEAANNREHNYQEIMKKLASSMKRSQETRKCLTMNTPKTEKYNRSSSVNGVLSSIETSSRQIQALLQTVQQMQHQRSPV